MEPYVFQEAPENVLMVIMKWCDLKTVYILGKTCRRLRTISKDFIRCADHSYAEAHFEEYRHYWSGTPKYRCWRRMTNRIQDEMEEGNKSAGSCEYCYKGTAVYRIVKWKIELLNLRTKLPHFDNGPIGIRYLCTRCLVDLGYCYDNRS